MEQCRDITVPLVTDKGILKKKGTSMGVLQLSNGYLNTIGLKGIDFQILNIHFYISPKSENAFL